MVSFPVTHLTPVWIPNFLPRSKRSRLRIPNCTPSPPLPSLTPGPPRRLPSPRIPHSSKDNSLTEMGISYRWIQRYDDSSWSCFCDWNWVSGSFLCGADDSAQTLTRRKLAERYKKVMLLNHPDRGGSPYLAMKINEARRVLMRYCRWPRLHHQIMKAFETYLHRNYSMTVRVSRQSHLKHELTIEDNCGHCRNRWKIHKLVYLQWNNIKHIQFN